MTSIYSLHVFEAIVEQKSFVQAARVLDLTPSAVSHMIAKMEAECGSPLFIRNRNNVELTESGKLLLPYIRNLIQCSEALDQQLTSLRSADSGIVRVGTFNSVAKRWMPQILKRFHSQYPDIEVVVMQSGDDVILDWIEHGDVELAICSIDSLTDQTVFPLHKNPMKCFAPIDYVPLNGETVTAEDLKAASLILQLEGYDTEPAKYLKDIGVPLHTDYRIETDETCITYVEQGLGLLVTPVMAVDYEGRNIKVYPLEKEAYRRIGLVTVYPEYITLAAELFRKEIFRFVEDSGLMNI
ncbi:MAG: LysR family transcriptional regulator [Anaerovoracaceae bacterium]|jgi:DNA-binding transcriptional LysR family regulator